MMFKKPPSENQLILVTFILVVLLAVPTFQTLMQKDPLIELALQEESVDASRSPASIPNARAIPLPKATSYFKSYDLNCGARPTEGLNVTGTLMQLQGKHCLKNFKDGDVEITNRTNGFTASVFMQGADKYQTDLIQLQDGKNEIHIRYQSRSGKVSEEIVHVSASAI